MSARILQEEGEAWVEVQVSDSAHHAIFLTPSISTLEQVLIFFFLQ